MRLNALVLGIVVASGPSVFAQDHKNSGDEAQAPSRKCPKNLLDQIASDYSKGIIWDGASVKACQEGGHVHYFYRMDSFPDDPVLKKTPTEWTPLEAELYFSKRLGAQLGTPTTGNLSSPECMAELSEMLKARDSSYEFKASVLKTMATGTPVGLASAVMNSGKPPISEEALEEAHVRKLRSATRGAVGEYYYRMLQAEQGMAAAMETIGALEATVGPEGHSLSASFDQPWGRTDEWIDKARSEIESGKVLPSLKPVSDKLKMDCPQSQQMRRKHWAQFLQRTQQTLAQIYPVNKEIADSEKKLNVCQRGGISGLRRAYGADANFQNTCRGFLAAWPKRKAELEAAKAALIQMSPWLADPEFSSMISSGLIGTFYNTDGSLSENATKGLERRLEVALRNRRDAAREQLADYAQAVRCLSEGEAPDYGDTKPSRGRGCSYDDIRELLASAPIVQSPFRGEWFDESLGIPRRPMNENGQQALFAESNLAMISCRDANREVERGEKQFAFTIGLVIGTAGVGPVAAGLARGATMGTNAVRAAQIQRMTTHAVTAAMVGVDGYLGTTQMMKDLDHCGNHLQFNSTDVKACSATEDLATLQSELAFQDYSSCVGAAVLNGVGLLAAGVPGVMAYREATKSFSRRQAQIWTRGDPKINRQMLDEFENMRRSNRPLWESKKTELEKISSQGTTQSKENLKKLLAYFENPHRSGAEQSVEAWRRVSVADRRLILEDYARLKVRHPDDYAARLGELGKRDDAKDLFATLNNTEAMFVVDDLAKHSNVGLAEQAEQVLRWRTLMTRSSDPIAQQRRKLLEEWARAGDADAAAMLKKIDDPHWVSDIQALLRFTDARKFGSQNVYTDELKKLKIEDASAWRRRMDLYRRYAYRSDPHASLLLKSYSPDAEEASSFLYAFQRADDSGQTVMIDRLQDLKRTDSGAWQARLEEIYQLGIKGDAVPSRLRSYFETSAFKSDFVDGKLPSKYWAKIPKFLAPHGVRGLTKAEQRTEALIARFSLAGSAADQQSALRELEALRIKNPGAWARKLSAAEDFAEREGLGSQEFWNYVEKSQTRQFADPFWGASSEQLAKTGPQDLQDFLGAREIQPFRVQARERSLAELAEEGHPGAKTLLRIKGATPEGVTSDIDSAREVSVQFSTALKQGDGGVEARKKILTELELQRTYLPERWQARMKELDRLAENGDAGAKALRPYMVQAGYYGKATAEPAPMGIVLPHVPKNSPSTFSLAEPSVDLVPRNKFKYEIKGGFKPVDGAASVPNEYRIATAFRPQHFDELDAMTPELRAKNLAMVVRSFEVVRKESPSIYAELVERFAARSLRYATQFVVPKDRLRSILLTIIELRSRGASSVKWSTEISTIEDDLGALIRADGIEPISVD